jgi:hypothetical protein
MGRLIVEQVVTADGYAADRDGGLDFFEALVRPGENGEVDLNDAEQLEYVSQADAILFGATTYRMFADYWPGVDPEVEHVAELINRLPKFVVSNTLTEAPWDGGQVEILRGDGVAAASTLKERFDTVIVWEPHARRCPPPCRTRRRAAPAHRAGAARRGALVHPRRCR